MAIHFDKQIPPAVRKPITGLRGNMFFARLREQSARRITDTPMERVPMLTGEPPVASLPKRPGRRGGRGGQSEISL